MCSQPTNDERDENWKELKMRHTYYKKAKDRRILNRKYYKFKRKIQIFLHLTVFDDLFCRIFSTIFEASLSSGTRAAIAQFDLSLVLLFEAYCCLHYKSKNGRTGPVPLEEFWA